MIEKRSHSGCIHLWHTAHFRTARDIRQKRWSAGQGLADPVLRQMLAIAQRLIGHEHADCAKSAEMDRRQPEFGDARKHVAVNMEKREQKSCPAQPG